jgi:hypothetical protein
MVIDLVTIAPLIANTPLTHLVQRHEFFRGIRLVFVQRYELDVARRLGFVAEGWP